MQKHIKGIKTYLLTFSDYLLIELSDNISGVVDFTHPHSIPSICLLGFFKALVKTGCMCL